MTEKPRRRQPTKRPWQLADPRSSHGPNAAMSTTRYRKMRATFIAAARPVCGICGRWVDKSLPGTHRWGPTIDHIDVPRRAESHAEAMDAFWNTARWRLTHRTCNSKRAMGFNDAEPRRQPGPSREW